MTVPASVLGALPSAEWAIEPSRAETMLATLENLDLKAAWEAQAAYGSSRGKDEPAYEVRDGVALLSLSGPMTKAPTCMGWLMGGSSSVELRKTIRQASTDPAVKAIMLVCDSPGGEVAGTDDLARELAAVKKPTATYAEDLMASAAAWVGFQADEVWANPTAQVGSIGVYTVVRDVSAAAKAAGVKTHVVASGRMKGAGVPGTEITDEQLDEARRVVGSLHDAFVSAVSRGRKMAQSDAGALADGRVHLAPEAKRMGMVDQIGSFDQAISALRKRAANGGNATTTPTGATAGITTKTMNPVQKLVAWAKGMTPEAARAADISPADIAAAEAHAEGTTTTTVVAREIAQDPEIARLKAQSDEQAKQIAEHRAQAQASVNARAKQAADDFAEKAFEDGRVFRAEVAPNAAAALVLIKAAGGGEAKIDADGNLVEGEEMKAFRAAMANRPNVRAKFQEPEIPSEASASIRAQDNEAALKATALGRRALALREKK